MAYSVSTQTACAQQNFILTHFMNKEIKVYCGHKSEIYAGKVIECVEGILSLEKDGKRLYVACDKIESMQEG
ncbi:MAG: hypothetical protein NTX50_32615 [Candidatus Sumerlaeota bacterium]|nr:hypothetical protein [Candidatus Sumerlaeota bacterium]